MNTAKQKNIATSELTEERVLDSTDISNQGCPD